MKWQPHLNPIHSINAGFNLHTIQAHREKINTVKVTPCGNYFLTAGDDTSIRLWQIGDGSCLKVFQGHSKGINDIALTRDGRFFVSASADGSLKVWDIQKEDCLRTLRDYQGTELSVTLSLDDLTVFSGNQDCHIRQWDFQTGKCLKVFERHPACQNMSRFNDLLRSSNSGFAYHNLVGHLGISHIKRQEGATFPGHADSVTAVAISPNGRFLLSGSKDNTLRLWNIQTGKCIWLFGGYHGEPNYSIRAVELTANGKYVFSVSDTLRIWKVSAKRFRRLSWPFGRENPSRELETIKSLPDDMAITSDGKYVFTIEDFGRYVRLYNSRKGALIQSFETQSARMTEIAVTPDNRFVIIGYENGEVAFCPLSVTYWNAHLDI